MWGLEGLQTVFCRSRSVRVDKSLLLLSILFAFLHPPSQQIKSTVMEEIDLVVVGTGRSRVGFFFFCFRASGCSVLFSVLFKFCGWIHLFFCVVTSRYCLISGVTTPEGA